MIDAKILINHITDLLLIMVTYNNILSLISDNLSLLNFVKKHKVPLKKVAIELNYEIVNKNKLSKIKLNNNDKVEIVHFIGGG